MKKYTAKEIQDEWYGTPDDLKKEGVKGNKKLQELVKIRNSQIKKKEKPKKK